MLLGGVLYYWYPEQYSSAAPEEVTVSGGLPSEANFPKGESKPVLPVVPDKDVATSTVEPPVLGSSERKDAERERMSLFELGLPVASVPPGAPAQNEGRKPSSSIAPAQTLATSVIEQPASVSSAMEVAKRGQQSSSEQVSPADSESTKTRNPNQGTAAEHDWLSVEAQTWVGNKTTIVPPLPVRPLKALIDEAKYPEVALYMTEPSLKKYNAYRERSFVWMAGTLFSELGYDSPGQSEKPRLCLQLRLGYEHALNDRWSVATGLEVRQYRFRTTFENMEENARIYQPGTIDTIFRNPNTGEELVSTTDTISGTRIRRFGNDNTATTVGIPILVRRYWSMGDHRFSLAVGLRVGIVLGRAGKIVIGDYQVIDLSDAARFGENFQVSGRLEAGYDWQFTDNWAIAFRLGAESALRDWSTNGTRQLPRWWMG